MVVPNTPPTAVRRQLHRNQCAFSSAGSGDSDGNIVSYGWDFGDGANSTGPSPNHTYTEAGNYTVTLTVTDNDGDEGSDTVQVSVTVPNQPPVAGFEAQCTGLSCTFDASGSDDPDGAIASYAWTFGDGGTGSGVSPGHTYGSAGTRTVELTVTDDDGGTDTFSRDVTVSAAAAISHVGSDSDNRNVRRFQVTVPGGVVAGDAMVLFFSQAATAPTVTPPAGWAQAGRVVDGTMATTVWQRVAVAGSAGSTVTVDTSALVKGSLTLSAYHGTSASPVVAVEGAAEAVTRAAHTTPTVNNTTNGVWRVSYWAQKSNEITGWTAQAGETVRDSNVGTGSGRIGAVLSDSNGNVGTGTQGGRTATASEASGVATAWTILLASSGADPNQPPVAGFEAQCTGLSCTFDASGSDDPDGDIASYAWTFGDGGTGSGVSPGHTYGSAGTRTVELTVTDDDGGTDTFSRDVTVSAAAAISHVGSDSDNRNVRRFQVTVPGGVVAGDAMVLFFSQAATAPTVTPPAGWAQAGRVVDGTMATTVWQRVAVAGSAGSTVTVDTSALVKGSLTLSAYHGTSASPVVAVEGAAEAVTRAAHTTPTVNNTTNGVWRVSYWAQKSNEITGWTAQAGETVRDSNVGTGSGRIGAVLSDSNGNVGTGTQGGRTATASEASGVATAWTILLH